MTMLERTAVALLNRQRNRYGLSSIGVGMFDPEEVESAKDLARAVLMAVRRPGMDAVNAGIEAGHAASGLPDILHVPSAFTAMIDAILNEKPEGLSDV